LENKQLEAQIEALFVSGRDVLDVKLAVDAIAGDAVPVEDTRRSIDAMVKALEAMIGGTKSDAERFGLLRSFIYLAGPWNENRPFAYDMSDPLGTKLSNKLLATYLGSRRGNCVSMPILFMILGERIGLRLTLARAPLHYFLIFTDESGRNFNVETTSGGGFTRAAWYEQEMPMNKLAIANGVYMRPLDDREVRASIASLLIEYFLEIKQPENAIIVADALSKHAPLDAYILVKKGTAYSRILDRDVNIPYAHVRVLRPEIEAYAERILRENYKAFAAAEALGWRETDGQK
jgi:regulator of sirC expression with transglutaminase-like and TPR domain